MSQPVLSLDGLTKSYGALQATNDVSLAVAAGEIHALIGPNGAARPPLSVNLWLGDAGQRHHPSPRRGDQQAVGASGSSGIGNPFRSAMC